MELIPFKPAAGALAKAGGAADAGSISAMVAAQEVDQHRLPFLFGMVASVSPPPLQTPGLRRTMATSQAPLWSPPPTGSHLPFKLQIRLPSKLQIHLLGSLPSMAAATVWGPGSGSGGGGGDTGLWGKGCGLAWQAVLWGPTRHGFRPIVVTSHFLVPVKILS